MAAKATYPHLLQPLLGCSKVCVVIRDYRDDAGHEVKTGQVIVFRDGQRIWQTYDDIYTALRSRLEIRLRYGIFGPGGSGELGGLDESLRRLKLVRQSLLRHDTLSTREIRRADYVLAQVADLTDGKFNPFKVEAHELAENRPQSSLRSRTSRREAAQRIDAIGANLDERRRQIEAIIAWIETTEKVMGREISRTVGLIDNARRAIRLAAKHRFFRDGKVDERGRAELLLSVRRLRREMDYYTIANPFRRYRQELDAALAAAEEGIFNGEQLRAVAGLADAEMIAERVVFRRELESMLSVVVAYVIAGKVAPSTRDSLLRRLQALTSKYTADGRTKLPAAAVDDELQDCRKALFAGDFKAAKEALKIAVSRF